MSKLDELKQYEIDGLATEQLIKEQDESLNPPEKVEEKEPPKQTNENPQITMLNVVKRVLYESLASECGPMGPMSNPEENVDPRLKNARKLVQTASDLIFKMIDAQRVDPDGNLGDAGKVLYNALDGALKAIVTQLHQVINTVKKEEPAPTDANAAAMSSVPGAGLAVPVEIELVRGEEIISPQGKKYEILEINENKVTMKDKSDGNKVSVEIGSVKKWKSNKK